MNDLSSCFNISDSLSTLVEISNKEVDEFDEVDFAAVDMRIKTGTPTAEDRNVPCMALAVLISANLIMFSS